MSPHPRIFAIANRKGGVGKTTSAVNLAAELAMLGKSVILIDMDPQANAGTALAAKPALGVDAFLLGEAELAEVLHETPVPGLFLMPAPMDAMRLEREIGALPDAIGFLRRKLLSAQWPDKIGTQAFSPDPMILLDSPPGLSLLALNALAAAEGVVVPLQCEFLALDGLSQILAQIEAMRQEHGKLGAKPELTGVVLTMFDPRTKLAHQVAEDVRRFLGKQLFRQRIPRNIRVSEAPSYGLPVCLYDPKCAGAKAYKALAREFLARMRRKDKAKEENAVKDKSKVLSLAQKKRKQEQAAWQDSRQKRARPIGAVRR